MRHKYQKLKDMKNNKFLAAAMVAAILLFVACTPSDKQKENPINLDRNDVVSIKEFVDSIRVIQLETTDSCLISRIYKVIYDDHKFYILDGIQECVFCFNQNGKFLYKIARFGQGPNEYLTIGDINMDPYHNKVLLVDASLGNLFQFDPNGTLASVIHLPAEIRAYNRIYPINSDTIAFLSMNRYNVVLYSRKVNAIISKQYDFDQKNRSFMSFAAYTYNDQVFFLPAPTVDVIDLSSGKIAYRWNFGKKNNTPKQIETVLNMERGKHKYFEEGLLNSYILSCYESNRYRYCIVGLPKGVSDVHNVFLDKKTGKSYVYTTTKEGIYDAQINFSGESMILFDRHYRRRPGDLFVPKCYDNSFLSAKQQALVAAHKSDDNPILFLYHLKQ
jgi:hypothetical protein